MRLSIPALRELKKSFAGDVRITRQLGDDGQFLVKADKAMAQAQLQVVEARAYDGAGTLIHPLLLERYRRRASASKNYAGDEAQYKPALHAHFDLVLEAIAAGRAELLRLHRAGEIDDRTLHELERDLDIEELGATSAKAT